MKCENCKHHYHEYTYDCGEMNGCKLFGFYGYFEFYEHGCIYIKNNYKMTKYGKEEYKFKKMIWGNK